MSLSAYAMQIILPLPVTCNYQQSLNISSQASFVQVPNCRSFEKEHTAAMVVHRAPGVSDFYFHHKVIVGTLEGSMKKK